MISDQQLVATRCFWGIACLTISALTTHFLLKHSDRIIFRAPRAIFSAVLFSCGVSILMDAWTYTLSGQWMPADLKAFIAIGSLVAVYALYALAPYALSLSRFARLAEARRRQLDAQSSALAALTLDRKNAEQATDAQRHALEKENQELLKRNDQLSILQTSSQRLVDDVAHDLRTPLSVIKGYSEIMRDGLAGPLSADHARFNQLIIDRTRDLAQMVDDMSDIIKLRAGVLHIDRAPCSVQDAFTSIRPFIDGRTAANKIRWVEQVDSDLPEAFADKEKVCRVLMNLIVNAIKMAPEQSVITLSARLIANSEIAVSISNEGPGMSSESLASMTERLKHSGDSPPIKGFGIGLEVAKDLAFMNLGQLSVVSEPQKGCTFSFTIPLNDPAIVLGRLLAHLDRLKTPQGSFCLLRVTPAQGGTAPRELWGFLASVARSLDVIFPTADSTSFILCGYSLHPDAWCKRLAKVGADVKQVGAAQRFRAFQVEVVGLLPYPTFLPHVVAALQGQIEGNNLPVPCNPVNTPKRAVLTGELAAF